MRRFVLPEKTLNDILGYLGDCPYREVHKLIEQIQAEAEQVEETGDDSEPPREG